MTGTLRVRLLTVLAVCAVFSPPLSADDPAFVQGLEAPTSYSFGELDTVNFFSGALQVTIPLGIEYPVSSQLSYRFTVHYNSNFWDINVMDPGSPPVDPPEIETVLNRRSNAGVGWRLSFGQLLVASNPQNPSGTFHTIWENDGTSRELQDVLYQPSANDAFGDGYFYSDDGSHLRLDMTSPAGCAAAPSPQCWTLEAPDGTIRHFDNQGRLSRVTDAHGGWMSIEYPTSGASRWVVRDSHNRQHELYIADDPTLCQGQPQCSYQRIDRIELAKFGGGRAVYQFHYTTALAFKLHHTLTCSVSCPTMTVPLLESITLPDGSSFQMTYNTGSNPVDNGELEELILPALGGYRWTYGGYKVSADPITNPLSTMPGVTQRSMIDRTGAALGSWSYTTFCARPDGLPLAANETLRCVTDPHGDATVHYFTTGEIGAGAPRGLPYGPVQTDGAGRRLSRQEFEGPANLANLKRSFWVDYLADVNRSGERISSEKTVFHDDLVQTSPAIPAEITVDRFDWDGRGHFRREVYGGNFTDGANDRTVTTNYNPDAGSWECTWDPSTGDPPSCSLVGGEVIPAGNEPWIFETYDFVEVQEESLPARRREYCFDEATGFLEGVRALAVGTFRSNEDVIELRTERDGYVGAERFYGGSPGPSEPAVTTASTWCTDPGVAPRYQIENFYQHGTRSERFYIGTSFFLEDYDIDLSTGLVGASRDSAGLLTTRQYDAMGRITEAKPQADEGAIVQLVYTPASLPSTPAKVTTQRRENGPGGTPGALLESSSRLFDDLGRLTREQRQLPTGLEERQTLYDVLGRKTSVSEWGAVGKQTLFLEYDRYGRPGRVRPPDSVSGHHDVTMTYQGMRRSTRTVRVATSLQRIQSFPPNPFVFDEDPKTTTRWLDRFGRLRKVIEPISPQTEATYSYDEADRLIQAAVKSGTITQNRFFQYDGRGFLLSETHPENQITYGFHDARGHPRATSGAKELLLGYDAAERLEAVVTPSFAPLQSFDYHDDNGAGWSNGKLERATRWSYLPSGTVEVTEDYAYQARGGAVSERRTTVSLPGGQVQRFRQGFEWTSLGKFQQIDYPCRSAGAPAWSCLSGEPQRTVSHTYSLGRLSSIPGVLDSVTHHPNGLLDQQAWTGGGIFHQTLDNSMPRPATLGMVGIADPWIHYEYDGAGNVLQELNEGWAYDGVGRVVTFDYGGLVGSFDYDGFGNRTSRTPPGGVGIPEPTSTATNRLTGAGVVYDSRGNLLDTGNSPNDPVLGWDPLNMLVSVFAGGLEQRQFAYTADNERILVLEPDGQGGTRQVWRLRDLDGNVLREYAGGAVCTAQQDLTVSNQTLFGIQVREACQSITAGPAVTVAVSANVLFQAPVIRLQPGFAVQAGATFVARAELPVNPGGVTWTRDFAYRDGSLVTTFESDGDVFKHFLTLRRDSRATLDANGTLGSGVHGYDMGPFGVQLSPVPESVDPNADVVKALHRFSQHEQDVNQVGNGMDDLVYLHARYLMPRIGRFLSVDPVMSADPEVPQSWNRYSYARNNPLTFTDPTGQCSDPGGSGARVCIQTFIPTKSFGGFRGDDRGALSSGGTFRTSQFLNVAASDKRALLDERFAPGVSRLGFLAREAAVADHNVLPTSRGIVVSAAASDGLLFGFAPDLKYELLLQPTPDGGLAVSGTHTAFPSLEVWLYEDGKEPELVYGYDAPTDGTTAGILDILREIEMPEEERP